LNRQHPNFKYLKLEEPLMIDKLVSIVDTVGDRVGVLEGWGGLYMLELIPKIVRLCGQNAFIPGYYLTPARYHYAVWTGSRMSHLSN
jgi:hypothetical protein